MTVVHSNQSTRFAAWLAVYGECTVKTNQMLGMCIPITTKQLGEFVYKERLLKLIEKLETVEDDNFNMRYWWCGTSGCAAGHACRIPAFKKAGLKTIKVDSSYITVGYQSHCGFAALELFFDLTKHDAHQIFSNEMYVGPVTTADVVERIKLVIEEHELILGREKCVCN